MPFGSRRLPLLHLVEIRFPEHPWPVLSAPGMDHVSHLVRNWVHNWVKVATTWLKEGKYLALRR